MVSVRPIDFARDAPALRAGLLDERDAARLDACEAAVRDGDALVYVLDDAGVARGIAVVHVNEREDQGWTPGSDTIDFQQGDNAFLENLGIAAPLQGRGLAGRLLAAVEAAAKARGKRYLWCHSRESNTRAHGFYEREGWVHERTVCYPWDGNVPRRVYRKRL
jgi:ribosomal protein S18 acetylase RimI-like enzyme